MNWQPIDTAPKDGRKIALAWFTGNGVFLNGAMSAKWDESNQHWHSRSILNARDIMTVKSWYEIDFAPTHWCEITLPDPDGDKRTDPEWLLGFDGVEDNPDSVTIRQPEKYAIMYGDYSTVVFDCNGGCVRTLRLLDPTRREVEAACKLAGINLVRKKEGGG